MTDLEHSIGNVIYSNSRLNQADTNDLAKVITESISIDYVSLVRILLKHGTFRGKFLDFKREAEKLDMITVKEKNN